MGFLVTTSFHPSEETVRRARAFAEAAGSRYVARGRRTLPKLRRLYGDVDFFVFHEGGAMEWHPADGKPFHFHLGMSVVRVRRLMQGQPDPMLARANFEPGDSVLDCTAGLASDAIVFAFAGGERTEVTAVESEWPIYAVVKNGLETYESELPELNAAMRRIRLVHRDHLEVLRDLPDRSVDIVYFDPMFQTPVRSSAGIGPLRALANPQPLREEAVAEARRVARKTVVLKERRGGGEWERLGFEPPDRRGGDVGYGVIRIET